uniref:Uncharacterized protein n=1 Tax=Palpitomonas bilix TaxID=652834 RepID=A0A7S3GM98_9EUKA|mmetsp:Transcript_9373/g.25463  ORF Transcript_9373/g.25463 Transcript_9373/m.25463 type:complete len:519 (+) Transcript_9373:201-1757(+)
MQRQSKLHSFIASYPTYAAVTILSTVVTILHFRGSSATDGFEFALSSNYNIAVFINAIIFFTTSIGKVLEYSFFIKFADKEKQTAFDDTVQYTLYKVVFVGVILSESHIRELVLWLLWFGAIGFFKVFQRIASMRLQYYSSMPDVARYEHQRVAALLGGVLVFDIFWLLICLELFSSTGFSTLLLLVFECFVLGIEVMQTLYNYAVNFKVFSGIGTQDNNEVQLFFSSFLAGIILDTVHLLHYSHIWYLYGVNFTVVDVLLGLSLYGTYKGVVQKMGNYRHYRNMLEQIEKSFDNATKEQLEELDDDCAICREQMASAKRLPCGHCFHKFCLRAWIERNRSCPVCRKPIRLGEAQDVSAERQGTGQQNVFYFPMTRVGAQGNTNNFEGADPAQQEREQGEESERGIQSESERDAEVDRSVGGVVGFEIGSSGSESDIRAGEFWYRVEQIKSIFPNMDVSVIAADLLTTQSMDATISNILQGRVRGRGGVQTDASIGRYPVTPSSVAGGITDQAFHTGI